MLRTRPSRLWLLPLLAIAALVLPLSLWENARLTRDAEALALSRARDLAEGLQASARLAARAEQTLREVLEDQLFAGARNAARALETGAPPDWPRLLREGGLSHVEIVDGRGLRLACSDSDAPGHPLARLDPELLAGRRSEQPLGLLSEDGAEWLAVAVPLPRAAGLHAARPPAALVAGIDAAEWRAMTEALGVGSALKRMTRGGAVRLALLEGPEGVLASSGPLPVDFAPLDAAAPAAGRLRRRSDSSGGVETAVPLEDLPGVWLRLVVDDGPERALADRGRLFLWLRSLALLALAGAVLAWRAGRLRLRDLEAERLRITADVRRLETERAAGERLRALGAMAGAVAHEIRNPLNTAAIVAQRLEREFPAAAGEGDGERIELLGALRSELGRIEERVAGFLEIARPPRAERRRQPLRPLLEELGALYAPRAAAAGHRFELDASGAPACAFDAGQLRQALVNLLENALQALGRAGRPGRLRLAARRDGAGAEILVEDDGPGVPETDRERIFDLYWTTRSDGTGLGLALARRIAAEHGGGLEHRVPAGGGALFRLGIDGEDA